MDDLDRRSALALGVAAASAWVIAVRVAEAAVGDEKVVAKGVKLKILGEGPAMIPGYKTVRLRDIIFEPGGAVEISTMANAMVCHISEGELEIVQDGKTFTAKTGHVWTCAVGTKEGAKNATTANGVMRIADLLTA